MCVDLGRGCEAVTLVESSLLSSIGYSSDQTLELKFRSGVTYRYFAVPEMVVEGFIAAESKGAYFNRHVRTASLTGGSTDSPVGLGPGHQQVSCLQQADLVA